MFSKLEIFDSNFKWLLSGKGLSIYNVSIIHYVRFEGELTGGVSDINEIMLTLLMGSPL